MIREDENDNRQFFEPETVACLMDCSTPEKIAVIGIRRDYFNYDGFKQTWNLDTLIIHELIHIIEKAGKKSCGISKKIDYSKPFSAFEEYNCDAFSAIIYYLFYNQI
jgi:hypothetical protein